MRISGTDLYIPQNDTTELTISVDPSLENYNFYMFVNNKTIDGVKQLVNNVFTGEVVFSIDAENFTEESGRFYYDIFMVNHKNIIESFNYFMNFNSSRSVYPFEFTEENLESLSVRILDAHGKPTDTQVLIEGVAQHGFNYTKQNGHFKLYGELESEYLEIFFYFEDFEEKQKNHIYMGSSAGAEFEIEVEKIVKTIKSIVVKSSFVIEEGLDSNTPIKDNTGKNPED